MKKITLVSLVLFLLISGGVFIGGKFSGPRNVNMTNVTNVDINNAPSVSNNSQPGSMMRGSGNMGGLMTMVNVSKHNTKNDCYLVVNDNIYDVSSYISKHPGGSRSVTSLCGGEVTGVFASIHSNRAWDLLVNYKIGTVSMMGQ